MENLFITNKLNLELFDFVRDGESSEDALARARSFYLGKVKEYDEIISDYGYGENGYWIKCRNSEQAKADALQIETETEYHARVRNSYLSIPAKEISEDKWVKMFEKFPPCTLTMTERYAMFYNSEALESTYHSFYLSDFKTGKFWYKICDSCDRTTWLDVALGLRSV